jgi:hypothetical protein
MKRYTDTAPKILASEFPVVAAEFHQEKKQVARRRLIGPSARTPS